VSSLLRTSPYANKPQYGNDAHQTTGTQNTCDIVAAAIRALDSIWREGYRFQKAGIMLNDFCDEPGKIDVLDETPPRPNSDTLMHAIDRINTAGLGKV